MEPRKSNVSRRVEPLSVWTSNEDARLIHIRSSRGSWKKTARSFPGRNSYSCKQRYQKIFNNVWDQEKRIQLARLYDSRKEEMWTKVAEAMTPTVHWTDAELNHWRIGQADMRRRAGNQFLTEARIDLPQLEAKNDEAQVQRQQQHPQQHTKCRTWSGDEEAILFAKYRKGMTWQEISTYFPGRTTVACTSHHFQLLGRCGAWSPERQNELCKEYERLKPEMWASIGEILSVSWRSAEEMHWELGKDGIAERTSASLIPQPVPDLAPAPREPGQTTKEWLNVVCNISED
ncbi:hypothetical protein E4U61_007716 [Claviceps capensis]|nr:hypothetical protein E4U61_007716 [Claviceps capensis]